MIWTIIEISLRRLLHNRVELLLTFVVPIAFFSVFAIIFSNGMGTGTTPKIKVIAVDDILSTDSQSILDALRQNPGLRFMDPDDQQSRLSIAKASELVRGGSATVGIVITQDPAGSIVAELLADSSDQVAPQVLSALVGREILMARAKIAARAQQSIASSQRMQHRPEIPNPSVVQATEFDQDSALATIAHDGTMDFGPVRVVDVIGDGKSNPVISMYAAGIAVMFLLFGATGGGGVLLEERENTTLDRLLSTRLTMDQLILGKWFYLTGLGFIQVSVMFIWGQLVFGVDLLGHLDGFVMMTLVTSSAAAAFGLFLATLCKTRGQLNGLSVILILTMSALGGSMVPRYVMSDRMRELGLWTFNAWALDGYDKIFWRELAVDALWPQLGVLMIAGITFLLVARALAMRWEFD